MEERNQKKNVIELHNLSFSYDGQKRVLDGVSFDIQEGSYTCIMGHNGSGKSTLAKLLLSLLTNYEGDIYLFGEQLTRKNRYSLRHRIGIVFQNPDNQFVGSSVADDIAFGLENKQVPTEEMQGMIEYFAKETGMSEFLDHEPTNLSGGQKQRVALAGVLAMKPDLLILDEATAMLDPKGKAEILDLIQHMRETMPHLTIVSITHDVEEASLADELIILHEGKLLVQGLPQDIFQDVESMRSMRLGVPFVYKLAYELRKLGVQVPANITTQQELEDFVCHYVSSK